MDQYKKMARESVNFHERIKGEVTRTDREVFGCPVLRRSQDLRGGFKKQNIEIMVIFSFDDLKFVILEVN